MIKWGVIWSFCRGQAFCCELSRLVMNFCCLWGIDDPSVQSTSGLFAIFSRLICWDYQGHFSRLRNLSFQAICFNLNFWCPEDSSCRRLNALHFHWELPSFSFSLFISDFWWSANEHSSCISFLFDVHHERWEELCFCSPIWWLIYWSFWLI